MANFVYRGIPIRNENGEVVAVQRVRGIVADNGLTYRGILSVDGAGNSFVYNQVPNDWSPVPFDTLFFLNTLPKLPNTRYIWLGEEVWHSGSIWIG